MEVADEIKISVAQVGPPEKNALRLDAPGRSHWRNGLRNSLNFSYSHTTDYCMECGYMCIMKVLYIWILNNFD